MLTHGDDYLTSVLPGQNEPDTPDFGTANITLTSADQPLTDQQIEDLNLEVRSILAHNCHSCHSSTKTKGELRLDKKEFVMAGGENGPVIMAGNPGESELIRRVTLPTGHKEAMPTKGKRLTEKEVALLEFWIKKGAPWPSGAERSIYRVAPLEPRNPVLPPATTGLTNPVDRFVNVYFQQNKVKWKKPVSDRIYIRRVFLDVVGLLPPPEKVRAFMADTRPDKREILVKELLNRNEDYAQHWLSFWNDALRNDYSGTGYITGGRFDITKWLYSSLKTNKPYNWFVRELISPTPESAGFVKGIKWRGTINSSQRTEMQAAQNVSQVFLGLNLKCASCHDSFISDWKLADAYAFANVFADTTLEINRCDKPTGKMAGRAILFKELGEISVDATTEQRLRELADFLVQPKDGRLYRTLVNRIWAQLLGRGIIEPVDMMDNLPWNQDLLDWLASDFVTNNYDIKQLMFTILTSKTYQLPSVGIQDAGILTAPSYVFEGMVRRRITAEQFADAVSVAFNPIYGDSALAVKRLPETIRKEIPFTRASLVKNDPFLTALGRPNRETVSTSRTSQANLLQALELTNGDLLNSSIKTGALRWKAKYPQSDRLVQALYRRALGRDPVPKEMAVAEKIIGKTPSLEGIEDLAWAIVLHPEFQLIY
jgi:mono/diheme cytochrome c family protein